MTATPTTGTGMNDSIFLALNWAAEIYGRAPLSMPAATWLYMTSGIKDQKAFILQLQELLMDIGEDELFQPAMAASGINSATLSDEILCAAERLLDVMERPLDARILGKQIIREILYHVLTGPRGGALLALVSRQTHFSLISRVLKRIETKYTENLNVEQLAAEANMSVSAFHHNFKAVTSTSPLQYLKSYRLHKARMMMIHDGMKASAAAMRVGYESASQFSREFKRFFGVTPGEDAARIRMMQGS